MIELITGGRNAGKTSTAIDSAKKIALKRYYIATARNLDSEVNTKIQRHKMQRGDKFVTVEEPLDIAGAMKGLDKDSVIVLDCLTMWAANMFFADREKLILETSKKIIIELSQFRNSFVVTNEVGLGIIPETALSRKYSSLLGEVNKLFASTADIVLLMVDGIPLKIKGSFYP
ncbi:MAG: adenosylcobinamide kinase/adenosylcobinamide phosphate guanyltransferase [bacterium]|nr:MAG: adenosylcobinamide kinase/adenosylcobinamide phosphate guanyltransferase [bacterium]